jgi:hypothetical protein
LIVQLDGASQAKSLSGWPTTDKADAMGLARLTEMGCCGRPSGRPRRIT